MNLSSMRFKSFVWPYNPRTYTIRYERQVALHKTPFGRYCLQNLGMTRRVMEGEGEFVGKDAYERFKTLATVFYDETPGVLIHPVWQSSKAYFTQLYLTQEPQEDYVHYGFCFWECFEEDTGAALRPVEQAGAQDSAPQWEQKPQTRFHSVLSGESLWKIAGIYGLRLEQLLQLNPQIKNPNLIHPGEQVRVA